MNTATTTCNYNSQGSISGNIDPVTGDVNEIITLPSFSCITEYQASSTAGISNGDALIASFVFMGVLAMLAFIFSVWFFGMKARVPLYNPILGNNSPEGKKISHD